MIAEQQEGDLRGNIMILPTDNPDDKNILTYKLETGWPGPLLIFLGREK